jgi:hypothetical protein
LPKAKAKTPPVSMSVIALEHFDNYEYIGPRRGDHSTLLNAFLDIANWRGSNTERFDSPSSFLLESFSTKPTKTLSHGDVLVVGDRILDEDHYLETLALFALEDLPFGINLFITNSTWKERTIWQPENPGILRFQISEAILGGTVFGFQVDIPFLMATNGQPVTKEYRCRLRRRIGLFIGVTRSKTISASSRLISLQAIHYQQIFRTIQFIFHVSLMKVMHNTILVHWMAQDIASSVAYVSRQMAESRQ